MFFFVDQPDTYSSMTDEEVLLEGVERGNLEKRFREIETNGEVDVDSMGTSPKKQRVSHTRSELAPVVERAQVHKRHEQLPLVAPFSTNHIFGADDTEHWRAFLDDQGYVVLKDVLPAVEVEHLMQLFWNDAVLLNPDIRVGAKSTYKFPRATHGMHKEFGIPHFRFAWELRLHPAIRQVFAHVHDVDAADLVGSADSVFIVTEKKPTGYNVSSTWLHRDQSAESADQFTCVQGLFSFIDSYPTCDGTLLVPGSHKEVNEWEVAGKRNPHFNQVPQIHQAAYYKKAIQPYVPAGGLLLFNSRTIHQGVYGTVRREGLHRLTVPICMQPSDTLTDFGYQLKVDIFNAQCASTHWANDEVRFNRPGRWDERCSTTKKNFRMVQFQPTRPLDDYLDYFGRTALCARRDGQTPAANTN